ncbi:hypothetical protein U0070_001917 [Myodes glareolus]|uniref:Uncharacterized protein n=1 Tax=Myodes glareolus TaxID=447135 RepID=A0AAW0HJU5_MYOGA
MSANGAVWGRVRSRLRAFPEHLAACGAEVSSGPSRLAGGGEDSSPGEAALPSGLPLGFGVRQVRAGLHRPRRPPEEGPVRARVRGPEELLRRRGQEDLMEAPTKGCGHRRLVLMTHTESFGD